MADIFKEVNPKFKYPTSISATVFEMVLNQSFYVDHLPRLSNLKKGKLFLKDLEKMINYTVDKLLA